MTGTPLNMDIRNSLARSLLHHIAPKSGLWLQHPRQVFDAIRMDLGGGRLVVLAANSSHRSMILSYRGVRYYAYHDWAGDKYVVERA